MCGVAGAWQPGADMEVLGAQARAMAAAIAHRGPDDAGTWVDAAAGLALGHRRLSILDLSAAGHQPMLSACGRWVIVFNGEIYNHQELRAQLQAAAAAPAWRGHSDTETLLAAIAHWGLEQTLRRCTGMFALALWDRERRVLALARDRLGEKPLYYGWQGATFLFGSELKALRAHPAFVGGIDRGALALLLRYNYVPAPYSIHPGIRKLPPGTWLELDAGTRDPAPRAYWSLREVAERGMAAPFEGSDAEAVDALAATLGGAVAGQRVADVPLGALLSGGIDSTLITALMQAQSPQPVRTFTIGFEEKAYDEADHARAVAAHLGTAHTELRLTAEDARALIPRMPQVYDEPFADSSQLPTCLVMQLARRHVTVALSGDGGDELFGGYNRYLLGPRVWRRMAPVPAPLRRMAGGLLQALPAHAIDQGWRRLGTPLGIAQPGAKCHRIGARLRHVHGLDDLHVELQAEWRDRNPAGEPHPVLLDQRDQWPRLSDPVARMMALDALTYLPDDILVKVDRAAMAVSLETRAPFLDHAVVELAWRLPLAMKLRGGRGKWILRQLLERHVPRALTERPKMGFGIPLDAWLRGPLRGWADDLLDPARLRRQGLLDPAPVQQVWQAHRRGQGQYGYRLWSVLMFQAWLDAQEGGG